MSERRKRLIPLKFRQKKFSKKVLGFDIETEGEKNNFVLACFKNDDTEYKFYDVESIIDFLNSDKVRNHIIVATNLGFDFLGCFMGYEDYWQVLERNGTIYGFTWYQKKNKKYPIKFFDTINYHKASVKQLGQIVNTEKMDHPECFATRPTNLKDWKELEDYCYNDAYISYKFMKDIVIKWCDDCGISLSLTTSSSSLKDFRRNFLKDYINVEDIDIHEKVFQAYYGGRTETFKRGTFKKVTCYDFNSEYPNVLQKEYPNPNTVLPIRQSSEYHINTFMGVSYVEGIQSERYTPPLPVRIGGKLKFPSGFIKGWYVHEEIRNAVNNGFKITKIGEGVVYKDSKHYFREFVQTHYDKRLELKKQGNPLQLMEKLAMNGLYGKFAFNYRESNSLENTKNLSADALDKCDDFQMITEDYVELKYTNNMNPTSYSFPIWSAYATAYARMDLYRFLNDPKIQPYLISCDTDSIFLDCTLTDDFGIETGSALGEMDLEDGYPTYDSIFIKPKLYFTIKPKAKGMKFDWSRTPYQLKEDFVDIIEGKEIEQERFIKYRTAIRSKDHHKYGKLQINQIIKIVKKTKVNDDKRFWGKDFNVNEIQNSTSVVLSVDDYEV